MQLVTGQFNDSYAPIADGVANVVKNYAYWLNKKYGKSFVVTPEYPGYSDGEEFEVLRYHSVPVPKRHPYRAGIALFDIPFQKELKRTRFDLVHAHCPFSSGRIALKMARDRGIPVVATFHSKFYDDFKEALKSEAVSRLLLKNVIGFFERVDVVWTVNHSTAQTLREYGFQGNVEVVENGTDFFGAEEGGLDWIREERTQRSKDRTLEFLFVGQHIWHKNLRLLIQALGHAKKLGVRFRMTMVGEGNASQEIRQLVEQLGMSQDFHFTGRLTDRSTLRELYAQADLFLFPSVYDNAPLVVREAASMGCPSILVRGSNAAENVMDGVNGFLAPNEEFGFAAAIQAAVSDTDRLMRAGMQAGNSLVRSWESIVDEVAGRYAEIVRINSKIHA